MNPLLNVGRLAMDGIPVCDLQEAAAVPSDDWFAFWAGRGDLYAELGESAVQRGHFRSGGQLLWLGSLCWHYAQYLWVQDLDRRRQGQARKVELYDKAAPHLQPLAERIAVPIDDVSMQGFMRMPRGADGGDVPCAVLLGGLESTKEESYAFENELLARGIATFAFDGPGQGEMWESVKLVADFERYTSTVLDYLLERTGIDPSKVGVVGRSLGGHYALKSASADARFACCVSWGGFYDMSDFDRRWPLSKQAYTVVTGAPDIEAAKSIVQRALTCEGVIDGLRCPTLHHHGALDFISLRQVDSLRERAVNAPLDVIIEPEGDHCCHNLGPRIRLDIVDWLEEKLVK